ncbi:shikimate dehydrogenase [Oerskovia paurometabola]|uniref:Shikimate dehydrogenase n=1 Tax=Oerskovia paurometabola TaxID=162170 RepID=A0ABW1XEX3_9CELL|nr:shikimate dehydrogenase [Oerskovia paurometabola]MBM7497485.1 shikimate dehydrogenase [Oerskovia paurometabola]
MTVGAVRRAAVLGHPVAHSLSPVLHSAAYRALGLDGWEYSAVDVTEEELASFVEGLDESWAGLSLTMPLKQVVLPLLDHVEPLAGVVGAVNTVLFQPTGSGRTLVGANTDVHGLVAALREGLGDRPVGSAMVLGAGATAASTLAALAELGCTAPTVLVRSLGRTGGLQRAAHRMGVAPRFAVLDPASPLVAQADVVVSTLPSRAADPVADALTVQSAAGASGPRGVLLDVVYDPRPTALSRAWADAGATVVGGERMLLHQAAEQVRLMTGRVAPLAAMAEALEAALAPSTARI